MGPRKIQRPKGGVWFTQPAVKPTRVERGTETDRSGLSTRKAETQLGMPRRHCICEEIQKRRLAGRKDAETQLSGELAIISEIAGRHRLKNITPQHTEPDQSSRPRSPSRRPRSKSRRRQGCTRGRGQPMTPDGRPIPGSLIPRRPSVPRRAPKNAPEGDPIRLSWVPRPLTWDASSDDEPPQPRPKRQQSSQFRPEWHPCRETPSQARRRRRFWSQARRIIDTMRKAAEEKYGRRSEKVGFQ